MSSDLEIRRISLLDYYKIGKITSSAFSAALSGSYSSGSDCYKNGELIYEKLPLPELNAYEQKLLDAVIEFNNLKKNLRNRLNKHMLQFGAYDSKTKELLGIAVWEFPGYRRSLLRILRNAFETIIVYSYIAVKAAKLKFLLLFFPRVRQAVKLKIERYDSFWASLMRNHLRELKNFGYPADRQKIYFLWTLAVSPTAQRRGVGKKLLEHTLLEVDKGDYVSALDASEFGAPLYAKYGYIKGPFTPVDPKGKIGTTFMYRPAKSEREKEVE
ncbi:hypothetical protein CANCADRAFT_4069 [Tortispora caseinolytica NRRL Y-17796]|uniref:N-acetyltransferase domain-containing protein n=1 Tax=Tortispora caseinolytica NRRL Y-17796 TaxID=767744 RepID=A0A1E4TCG0_9ASCO|nr:hypothetical protein CANCADRAFT_4069 [Tortispora caseinolytica NRRL Y-17796]